MHYSKSLKNTSRRGSHIFQDSDVTVKTEVRSPSHFWSPKAKSSQIEMDQNKEIVVQGEEEKQEDHWGELKPKNKAIYRRSYHSAVIYKDYLYVYGGYEINMGFLSDIYRINIAIPYNELLWEKIDFKKGAKTPGPLSRHTAIVHKDCMYIFGGQKTSTENTNKIFEFNFEGEEFQEIISSSELVPDPIDSHCANLWIKDYDNDNVSMIISFGFVGGSIGMYTNAIWEFNFKTNTWSLLSSNNNFEEKDNIRPVARMCHSASVYKNNLYIFGGTDSDARFNDFWKFDLISKTWELLDISQNAPEPRNGHTFSIYNDLIILFGGIHDITHEKNDIYVFDLSKNKWIQVEVENRHNMQRNKSPENHNPKKSIIKSPNDELLMRRGSFYQQRSIQISPTPFVDNYKHNSAVNQYNNKVVGKKIIQSPYQKFKPEGITPRKPNNNIKILPKKTESIKNESLAHSPLTKQVTMTARQLKKGRDLQIQKTMLLSNFDVDENKKSELRGNSPTTTAMKNSIQSIGSAINNYDDLKDILLSSPRNAFFSSAKLESMPNQYTGIKSINQIYNKKPCARDGHSATVTDDRMIIFGGDRHKMCFNDIYVLDLKYIEKFVE